MRDRLSRFWDASHRWPIAGQIAMAVAVIFVAAVIIGALKGGTGDEGVVTVALRLP